MAKKTTARAKSEPKPEAVAATPKAPARAKTTQKAPAAADTIVAVKKVKATVVSIAAGPTDEDIRARAYQRYLERGGNHGMDFDDWLEAERELRQGK